MFHLTRKRKLKLESNDSPLPKFASFDLLDGDVELLLGTVSVDGVGLTLLGVVSGRASTPFLFEVGCALPHRRQGFCRRLHFRRSVFP
jgi:hypothetical protein